MEILRNIYNIITRNDSPNITEKPKIVAFGNVLLDSSVKIDTVDILERYGLTLDAKGEVTANKLAKIAEEVRSWSTEVIPTHPGGSALNSVRILKKLGCEVLFFGAVGSDDAAQKLRRNLKEAGVRVSFQEIATASTGQCICFVYNDQTALYANIGASSLFTIGHLKSAATDLNFLSHSSLQIIYIEGFFIPKRFDVCRFIIGNFISDQRQLAVNLSAPYIVAENFQEVQTLIENSSLVFGNRQEYLALARMLGCGTIEEAVDKFGNEKCTFVVTNGGVDVQIISKSQKVNKTYPVPAVEGVVDTTGAGDSFVAGFLDCYVKEMALEDCLLGAVEVSAKVVRQVGCNLPGV